MANSKKLLNNNLVNHVADKLKQWVKPNQHIVVALSGGLDSVVLLDILRQLASLHPFTIFAVHCNHQISPNANEWVNFCKKLCGQHNIPLQVFVLDLAQHESREGLEAIARQARYSAFAELKTDFLALAHHLDDQAETLMLRLLRGAGVKGLGAMLESRPLSRQHISPTLVRPLLNISRENLKHYAIEHGLKWIEDESNSNVNYSRNFLRRDVLPKIEKHFPGYRQTLTRASQNFVSTSALLEEIAKLDAQYAVMNGRLQLHKVQQLSPLRFKNLLRYFLNQQGILMPSKKRLEQIFVQLIYAQPDAQICIKHHNFELRRFKGELYIDRPEIKIDHLFPIRWNGEETIWLPNNLGSIQFSKQLHVGIALKKITDGIITIRLRQGGEKIQPDCKRPRRTLKNLLQEVKSPPWERQNFPLIFYNEELIFAPQIGVDCQFHNIPNEIGLVVSWKKSS